DLVLGAAVYERVQAEPGDDRLVGTQLTFQAVEEAQPALHDTEAVGTGERLAHRAISAHRVACDRAPITVRQGGQHTVHEFLHFDDVGFIVPSGHRMPVV